MKESQLKQVLISQLDVNLELMGTITSVIKALNLSKEDHEIVYARLSSSAEKNEKLIKHMQALLNSED